MTKQRFQKTVYDYFNAHKRSFPWRDISDPYKIFVSEIMLQQTQADRVVPKFEVFIKKFPTIATLSRASVSEVVSLWQGLGYNRRALALKKSAEIMMDKYAGKVPAQYEDLVDLPGVGPYTARVVLAFAFHKPGIVIETNIRRVFLHFFFPKENKVPDEKLFPYIEKMQDVKNPACWYSALMDYGAMLKATQVNANIRSRHYIKQSRFEGSGRQVRGAILKYLVQSGQPVHVSTLQSALKISLKSPPDVIDEKILELVKEGFVLQKKNILTLP